MQESSEFDQQFQDCLANQLLPKAVYLQLMLTLSQQYHPVFSRIPETAVWLPARPEGLNEILQQMLSHEDLVGMAKDLYRQYFTTEELRELVAFSVSPTGKKLAGKSGLLMAETGQLAEKHVADKFTKWLEARDEKPETTYLFTDELAHLFKCLLKEPLSNGDYANLCSIILHQFARHLKLPGGFTVDTSKAPVSVSLRTDRGFVLSFLAKDAISRSGGAVVFRRSADLVDASDCLVANHVWKFTEIAADYNGFLNEISIVLQGLEKQ